MPPDAAEVRRWLQKAAHDRRSAEALLATVPPITDTAAFHCQQAVEKLRKAYLFSRGVDFERTHDLRALVLLCADQDASFGPLEAKVAPLTPYAVRFRYPGPADPAPAAVRAALTTVADVEQFVCGRLPTDV